MAGDGGGTGDRLRRARFGNEAAAYARELIMSGQVRAGEYLRVERLAKDLGISATPAREALLALRGEGFVEQEPWRGFVVLPLNREDVLDLYLVQAGLAGELAARAATRVGPEDLAQLQELQARLEAAEGAGDAERVERLNHHFHRAVNLVAGAPKLAWFLSLATRYAPRRFYPTIHGWPAASVQDHVEILDALRRGDAPAARESMHRHITHAGELLAAHLDRDERWT